MKSKENLSMSQFQDVVLALLNGKDEARARFLFYRGGGGGGGGVGGGGGSVLVKSKKIGILLYRNLASTHPACLLDRQFPKNLLFEQANISIKNFQF